MIINSIGANTIINGVINMQKLSMEHLLDWCCSESVYTHMAWLIRRCKCADWGYDDAYLKNRDASPIIIGNCPYSVENGMPTKVCPCSMESSWDARLSLIMQPIRGEFNLCDLSNLDLRNHQFGVYEHAHVLCKSKFWNCAIKNSNLSGIYMNNIECDNVDFTSSILENITGVSAKFINCRFNNVTFDNSVLIDADFSNSQLRSTSFVNVNLRNANFNCADLRDANFTNTDITGASFDGANLEGVILNDDADITLAPFSEANFKGALLDEDITKLQNTIYCKLKSKFIKVMHFINAYKYN